MNPSYIHWLRQHIGHQKTIIGYGVVIPRADDGRVLLQRRADIDIWGLPGGVLEPEESILTCVRREAREETGMEVDNLRLVGIYTDPRYDSGYPNGDQVQQYSVCFEGRITGGVLGGDPEESQALAYFPPNALPFAEMPIFYIDMLTDGLRGGPPIFEAPRTTGMLIDNIARVRPYIGHEEFIGCGAMAAVVDDAGRLLVGKRSDDGSWSMPGGFTHLGENAAYTVVREVCEETGYEIQPVELIGISSQSQAWVYPNGDRTVALISLFLAKPVGGQPRSDGSETTAVAWMSPEELLRQPVHPNIEYIHRAVVSALNGGPKPFIVE